MLAGAFVVELSFDGGVGFLVQAKWNTERKTARLTAIKRDRIVAPRRWFSRKDGAAQISNSPVLVDSRSLVAMLLPVAKGLSSD